MKLVSSMLLSVISEKKCEEKLDHKPSQVTGSRCAIDKSQNQVDVMSNFSGNVT